MVEKGLIEEEDRDGNHEADAAASRGIAQGLDLTTTAKFFEKRQEEYGKLMRKVRKYIVRTKEADREKRR